MQERAQTFVDFTIFHIIQKKVFTNLHFKLPSISPLQQVPGVRWHPPLRELGGGAAVPGVVEGGVNVLLPRWVKTQLSLHLLGKAVSKKEHGSSTEIAYELENTISMTNGIKSIATVLTCLVPNAFSNIVLCWWRQFTAFLYTWSQKCIFLFRPVKPQPAHFARLGRALQVLRILGDFRGIPPGQVWHIQKYKKYNIDFKFD